MKLKEIKNCMAICCTNIEQVRELDKKMKSGKCFEDFLPFPCYILTDGKKYYGCVKDKNFISSKNYNPVPQIVNFSDLIIQDQDLSAEEALSAYDQMCRENYCCSDCPIYGILGRECTHEMDGHITEIVDAIKKWKSDHEKKEPEIETEWFWQGRIFKVEKDGSYYQIKDGTGFYDTGCEYQESAEEYMNEILKEYCKTHDGDYIAFVNHVCRVKAVE